MNPPDFPAGGGPARAHTSRPYRSPRLWWLGVFLSLSVVTVAGSWPVLANPQLEPDDYRYLALLQELETGSIPDLLEAGVVENRWDHLWWMGEGQVLRFFRPIVLASYALDARLDVAGALGFILTNVLINLTCALLVAGLLVVFLGRGASAWFGALAFASMTCHSETLWYVAGRTDSLAALGALVVLLLHARLPEDPGRKVWPVWSVFLLALLTKETAIAAPVAALVMDRLSGLPLWSRERRSIWIGYGAAFGIFAAIRAMLAGGASWVFPYTVSPFDARFPAHLWVQFRLYTESLFAGSTVFPFVQPQGLAEFESTPAFLLGLVGMLVLAYSLVRDRRGFALLALGVVAWLPTSMVYVSERYLYLPSVAVAGLAAFLLADLRHRGRVLGVLGLSVMTLWAGTQLFRLNRQNDWYSGIERDSRVVESLFEDLGEQIPVGAQLVWIDFPYFWLTAQFIESMLRVQLEDPSLHVTVLNNYPWPGMRTSPLYVSRPGSRTVRLSRAVGLIGPIGHPFERTPCVPGTEIIRPELPFEARVVQGNDPRCVTVDFVFPGGLDELTFVRYVAGQQLPAGEPPGRGGKLEIMTLPPIVEPRELP